MVIVNKSKDAVLTLQTLGVNRHEIMQFFLKKKKEGGPIVPPPNTHTAEDAGGSELARR